jgi:hypothetical protein
MLDGGDVADTADGERFSVAVDILACGKSTIGTLTKARCEYTRVSAYSSPCPSPLNTSTRLRESGRALKQGNANAIYPVVFLTDLPKSPKPGYGAVVMFACRLSVVCDDLWYGC